MRAVLIGLGSIGLRHLGNMRLAEPDAEIIVVRHARSADAVPPGADRVVYSIEEAVAARPDVAFICGPTSLHAEYCLAMLEARAHVFVEKPIAPDAPSAERVILAAEAADRALIVGYNLRFLPSLRALKKALDAGAIGRPLSARVEVGQYLPDWRPGTDYRKSNTAVAILGGGIELELSHELDYIGWLLGEPASVNAVFARCSDLEVEGDDTAEMILHMRSGALVNVHMDLIQRAPTRTCRIIGTDGTLVWDGINGTVMQYLPGDGWSTVFDGDGERNDMYTREIQHVFACARRETSPLVSGREALQTVRVANAARASSNTGRKVIL